MNKEILEEKIAILLKVSDQEKNLAFKIFKEKLSETLQIGEAIRINDLGVFQLKEQLDHRSVSKSGEKLKSLTLVFSPESDDPSANSLFVNLEIENSKKDETEFNENVFQLGIGKPLVIDSNQNIENVEKSNSDTVNIENEVSKLFEKSEKLKSFDLWEDYLERKGTTNILEDSEENDLSIDSILEENEDEITELDIEELDEEIIQKTEDEILDLEEGKNELLEDDFDDLVDETDEEVINIPVSIDDSMENILEEDSVKLDDIDLELNGETLNTAEINDKSFIEKIDEELAANEISDEPIIDEKIYEDELNTIGDDDSLSIPEDLIDDEISESIDNLIDKEISDLNGDEDIEKEEDRNEDEISAEESFVQEIEQIKHQQPTGTKNKSLLWLFILAFITIGAISIYFLLFNSKPIPNSEVKTEILSVEGETATPVDDDANDLISDEKEELESPEEDLIESPNNKESKNISNESKTEVEKTNSIDNEYEVAKNIYYDGFVYNVQVSSWKQEKIAQNEVNKLVKGGYPAYKVKVYIPKFDGYWHRVRIGPFTSKQEAEETLKKVNK